MTYRAKSSSDAFTIVELLIVIVVIGILAAITIVSFNGVQNKAKVAAAQSSLNAATKQIESARVTAGTNTYPTTIANLDTNVAYKADPALGGFCAVNTQAAVPYMTTASNLTPHTGPASAATDCKITNLIGNPSFESGMGNNNWNGNKGQRITLTTTADPAPGAGSVAGLMTRNSTTAGEGYVGITTATTVGTRYSLSLMMKTVSGVPNMTISVRNWNAGWSISDNNKATIAMTPPSTYTKYTLTWTATDTVSFIILENSSVSASASSIAFDAVIMTEGENSNGFADPTTRSDWAWNGSANGFFTSTGTAF